MKESRPARYAVSVLAIILALGIRLALNPLFGEQYPYILFFLAVMVAAWYGGLGPGLLATALTASAAMFFFQEPLGSPAVIDSAKGLALALFVASGVAISALNEERHRFMRRIEAGARELQSQRERLHVTLTSIGDAVIATDAQGRVSFMNRVAQALTGWNEAAALGKDAKEVFHIVNEETREEIESPVAKVLREGKIVGLANHTLLIAKDSTERPIDDSGAPIRDALGSVIGVVLVFRDISERRQAERALRESGERLSLALDGAGMGTWDSDLRTGKVFWSEEHFRILGYEPVDGPVSAEWWRDRIHPDDREPVRQALEEAKANHSAYRPQHRIIRADNSEVVWIDVNGRFFYDEHGEPVRMLGVVWDITDRKQTEEERQRTEVALRRQAEELTQAHRAKDQFLAMLAHELRNPLAPIRNAVRILQQLGPPEPRLERARAIIDRQVSHQARLLDDLFDVSRLTRGMTTLCKERLDLAQLIRHVADDSQGLMEQAGVTFSEEIPEESVWVEGDPIRLAQIVGNLCGNAAKFTERGGHVGLRLAVEAEKKRAVITVRDTGIGIDPEMLPRVFDVFAQADQSLHRSPGGLGLGLALVKGLTELHGGQVRAASEGPGCGSEFTVLLPLASAPVTGETVRVPVTPSARPARVLIVEDSRDTAETLRDVLELSGNTVGVAYSGPEAVELARQFQPGVVLCDLGLPGMDGYEVAKALRRDPETQAARLIAVSGYGQEEDVQRSREAGFDLHLTKPIDLERLERILAISTEEETSPSIAATRPNDAYPNGR